MAAALLAAIVVGRTASSAEAEAGTAEIRDMLLMLDGGPLRVRLHISVAGKSPLEARQEMVARVIQALDTNKDGQLARDEAQRSPIFREKQRPGAAQFLKEIGADMTLTPSKVSERLETLGGETVRYRQNTSSSETDDEVFKLLDGDADGTVTEVEMFNAVDLLLAKDSDDDECVTLDEFAPPPDPNMVTNLLMPNAAPRTGRSVADIVHDTHQTLLPAQLIQKYDTDRNRLLSAAELNWSPDRLEPCDKDQDGQLSVTELAGLSSTPADIELAVDVVRLEGRPMLRVLSAMGEQLSNDQYPDLATVKLPAAVVTFSSREVDPFEVSMAVALRTFNELDADANGYLDRDETMSRERFGRGMFDQVDADGDGKIFGEEMKDFIRSRGEPIATTCEVTAYDDGSGFYSTLDANGDRRISMREMRYADKSLGQMERDSAPGIKATEPARRYRIEFVRGVYNPFGTPDRPANMVATDASAKPRPVGPIWFQRWDRNNDGDVTWREFLGPRDVFEQLDVDRDGLIDPREAEAAVEIANAGPRNSVSESTGNGSGAVEE